MVESDNILLKFTNIETFDGNNDLIYYYRNGSIFVEGQENLFISKELNLNNEQLSRTTRLVKREDNPNGQEYTTIDGEIITLRENEELYVSHNYTGDLPLDKDFNNNLDSWFYDQNWHKNYRIYLVVSYNNTETTTTGDEMFDFKVRQTFTIYKDDEEDDKSGVYTFSTIPPEDIGITASVVLDQKSTGNVWETANLSLYYNNSPIANEELDLTTVTLPERMTLLVDYPQDAISKNDQLKMSVSVANSPIPHNDALLVTSYTMSISTDSDVVVPNTFLGFNNNIGLERDFDCQPTFNNIIVSRQSEFVQDVDYSISSEGSGSLIPQNLSLILSNRATKATVPDSNYTQYSSIIPKYYGSKTNRTGVNESEAISFNNTLVNPSNNDGLRFSPFYMSTDNLGSFPNVESRNSYIGYFEKVLDPYPVLNSKTAYFVKYLVDENKDVLDPSITTQGLNNLKNTFKLNDINNLPTSVKASVQNIDEARELKDLENFSTVYKTAVYPTPILFSQTSSNAYAKEISLSGSSGEYLIEFDIDNENYKNLAFIASETRTYDREVSPKLLTFGSGNSKNRRLKPIDVQYIATPNEKIYNNGYAEIPSTLTDDYTYTLNFNFYTTHFPPTVVSDNGGQKSLSEFGFIKFKIEDEDTFNEFPIDPDNVKLTITRWYNNNEVPMDIGEGQSQQVIIQGNQIDRQIVGQGQSSNRDPFVDILTTSRNNENAVKINFDSVQIYNKFNQTFGGVPSYLYQDSTLRVWEEYANASYGYNEPPVYVDYKKGSYLEWKIEIKVAINPYAPAKIGATHTSNIVNSEDTNYRLNFNDSTFDNKDRTRQFNPPEIEGANVTREKIDLRGLKTPAKGDEGVASVPYWNFYGNSRNQIILVSNLLNNLYGFNYFQIPPEYVPGPSTFFPFGFEPNFINMPTPSDPWEVEVGDQIRFENSETQSYNIISIRQIDTSSGERLILILDRNVTEGVNLDFFLIRRFKSANNFVILNQQKPYGVPLVESSAPGILQTQYQNQELENNPDKVITNLIERNLI
jgi:hypothetical protein